LGEGVKIGPHTRIVGPTVLRDYVSVDVGAVIDSSIVWRNSYVGERAELHGALVGRQCALKSRVVLEEGSVIGDHSVVNENARVRAQVKVWPDKQIESGAVVGSSLIWGAQGRRALFGRFGVTGIVNIDLTPEFISRLGAAYASTRSVGETIFFREDLRRVSYDDVERIYESPRVGEAYSDAFLSEVAHRKEITDAKPKIVVNYSHGTAAQFLPQLLNRLGIEVVAVNGIVSENIGSRSFEEFQEELRQLAVLVPALGAQLGVIIDAGGEKVFVVDDRGRIVNDMHFLAAFVSLTVRQAPGVVAVPVYAPSSIEEIVAGRGGRVQRVRASAEAQMSLAAREQPLLVGDGVGGFIFPRFHPSFDGLFATVRLLELLIAAKQSLSEVVDATPPVHVARLQVGCPWDQKGRVMRMLAQDPQTERTRQVDGVKHQNDGEWVVVLPDADRPLFNVYAEGPDDDRAWTLVHEYAERLERLRAS